MKHVLLVIFTILSLLALGAPAVWAQEVRLPSIPSVQNPYRGPAEFVQYLFILGLGLGGILAFGMIVFAGLQWSLSGGNASWQEDAKDRIRNAIFGLILLFGAYVILRTINPDLVNLRQPNLQGLTVPPPANIPNTQTPYNPSCARWNEYRCVVPALPCSRTLGQGWENANPDCPSQGAGAACVRNPDTQYCGHVLQYAEGGPSPVTPFSPDPYGVDIQNMDPEARQSLQNMIACASRIGGSVQVNSAYRPQAYQDHLKEVFCKYQCAIEGLDPQAVARRWSYATYCGQYVNFPCTPGRYDPHYNDELANITTEWSRHGMVAAPANTSRHTTGCGVDMNVSGIDPSRYGFIQPLVRDDPVHYDHAFCPTSNNVFNPPCTP
jgi:hypothetical protein